MQDKVAHFIAHVHLHWGWGKNLLEESETEGKQTHGEKLVFMGSLSWVDLEIFYLNFVKCR